MGDLVGGIIGDSRQNIHGLLADFAAKDNFMRKLIDVSRAYADQRDRGEPTQEVHCLILRSDYMIDKPTHTLKLVEYNTIASSFGCLSFKVRQMHDYIVKKYGDQLPLSHQVGESGNYGQHLVEIWNGFGKLPMLEDDYSYVDTLASKFARAIELYQESTGRVVQREQNARIWVLFVCEDDERNLCDQKAIEVTLQSKFKILSMRKTMAEIAEQGQVDPQTKKLTVAGKEIGFVYYRTGYQADHYMDSHGGWDDTKWKVRTDLECSMAVKCPSIDLHLATFKKFQQSFSDESLLRQVCGSDQTTETLKGLFKGIWSLEDLGKEGAEVNDVVARALQDPHQFVLKPQKEGGGNNFFDEELKANLIKAKDKTSADFETLSTYLLMERINPPMVPAVMLRNGAVHKISSLSEFGFFSCVFERTQGTDSSKRQTIENEVIGTLMRTKASHFNEGGVNAGFSVIDNPLVLDHQSIVDQTTGDWIGTLQF